MTTVSAGSMLAIDGGHPVRTRPWPTYDKGDAFISAEDEAAVVAAIQEHRFFRYDDRPLDQTYTGRLERRLCEMFGTRHALACTSGTTAIALALLALDLPPSSPVACPAFTFPATPSAILLAGHRPVLVECDENLHLDVTDLARVLDQGVKAAVVVHMRGYASDMPAIMALARARGVPVVEDAVPALGATLHGRHLGTFGDFGAFSTQSDKSLNTGEGGFLLTDDTDAYARAVVFSGAYEGRLQRHFPDGDCGVDDLAYPIFGVRMDEIRAALAGSLLDRLPRRLALHQRNHDHAVAGLSLVPGITLRRPVAEGAYLGEALIFRLPGATAAECSWFARALHAEGIEGRALGDPRRVNVRAFWHWRFLLGPDQDQARARLPATARYVAEAIDIPMSANLSLADCDDLVAAVTKVAAAFGGLMSRPACPAHSGGYDRGNGVLLDLASARSGVSLAWWDDQKRRSTRRLERFRLLPLTCGCLDQTPAESPTGGSPGVRTSPNPPSPEPPTAGIGHRFRSCSPTSAPAAVTRRNGGRNGSASPVSLPAVHRIRERALSLSRTSYPRMCGTSSDGCRIYRGSTRHPTWPTAPHRYGPSRDCPAWARPRSPCTPRICSAPSIRMASCSPTCAVRMSIRCRPVR
ncbi:MAG TPA: aminotransferase class I/II-fold pyridoxal phosphate-dependent enzyme [Streptosporangiaceae bacterium]|jgi:dTDP-4-amino-4,6-dideoxygalactose transaminase